jgi:hypothetical protein
MLCDEALSAVRANVGRILKGEKPGKLPAAHPIPICHKSKDREGAWARVFAKSARADEVIE